MPQLEGYSNECNNGSTRRSAQEVDHRPKRAPTSVRNLPRLWEFREPVAA